MAKAVEFQINIKSIDGGVLEKLTIEATGLEDALSQVGQMAQQASGQLTNMAENSLIFESLVQSIQLLRDGINDLAEPFNSFETAMHSANTMAGKSGEDFEALTDKVVELSKNIPLAREELANGLYQTISNGVPEDNWIDFLEQSSKAAVGGLADLGQTVTVTSTLIKNYGLNWDQAQSIQDKMQMTAKNGVTSFEQLGQALPRVSGSASQLGVSLDELLAVFATTTGVTGNTAEVSTQLAAVLNALIKPSAEATQAAEAMGIGFNAASVQAAGGLENFLLGLDASIQEYSAKTGQLSETIYGQLFGSAEALRVLGSLTGEQKDKFSENIAAMADSAGTIEGAFNEMKDTGESFDKMLKNQVLSMFDWIGSVASTSAPYVNMIANTGLAITSLGQLKDYLVKVASGLNAARIATLAQAAASKIVVVASNVWKIAQISLNAVLSANPIGIVIMAIAGLVAILIAAYNNSETFRNICNKVWSVVKSLATAVWNYLVKAFERASAVIKAAWEWVKTFFGIGDTGVVKQTGAIEKQTKAIKENTKEKAANAQQTLKANRALNAPTSSRGTTSSIGGKTGKAGKGGKVGHDNINTGNQYDGKILIENASSYKELGNNIQFYQNKLETTKGTETKTIALYAEKIAQLKKQQESITKVQELITRPKELDTLEKINKEIAYQQSLRERATRSELLNIDKEINCLNDLKMAFQRNAHIDIGIDKIRTYKQLEDELRYYSDLLRTASEEERLEIQKQINSLEQLRKQWDETLDELKKPQDISMLHSIDELDKAISYYQSKQKKASASEISEIERTLIALNQKRDALKSLTRIPSLEDEVGKLDTLSGKELSLELKVIGIDGIRKRIKELRDMLSDVKNPMDENQRAEVNKLVDSYENYQRILKKSNITVERSWGAIKGIGGGIHSLTDALEGNRGAWETITGVVDAAIQIYQGISTVISIINALTAATGTSNAVVTASGVAATTATSAKIAAAPEEVGAAVSTTAATKALAMAYRELAASEFMAAHAFIPFAGAGIAAGFIGMMEGLVASVAVTPFANGGLVYGPTLALMGEYSGAKSNPEVIAPLNKLKSLIGDTSGGFSGKLEARLKGRDIILAIANETRINRKKTNIRI